MKKKVLVSLEYEIEIADEKIPDILKDFRDSISSYADIDDVFKQIAWTAAADSSWVEGVGQEDVEYQVTMTDSNTEII